MPLPGNNIEPACLTAKPGTSSQRMTLSLGGWAMKLMKVQILPRWLRATAVKLMRHLSCVMEPLATLCVMLASEVGRTYLTIASCDRLSWGLDKGDCPCCVYRQNCIECRSENKFLATTVTLSQCTCSSSVIVYRSMPRARGCSSFIAICRDTSCVCRVKGRASERRKVARGVVRNEGGREEGRWSASNGPKPD